MNSQMQPPKPRQAELLYPDLAYRIIEAAFEVHNQLGPGFTEDIYERAMLHELRIRNIPFEEQKVIQVVYKGVNLGTYRLDMVVDGVIILELKAVATLAPIYKQQILSYLKATNLHLGILLNFGSVRVESARVVN